MREPRPPEVGGGSPGALQRSENRKKKGLRGAGRHGVWCQEPRRSGGREEGSHLCPAPERSGGMVGAGPAGRVQVNQK